MDPCVWYRLRSFLMIPVMMLNGDVSVAMVRFWQLGAIWDVKILANWTCYLSCNLGMMLPSRWIAKSFSLAWRCCMLFLCRNSGFTDASRSLWAPYCVRCMLYAIYLLFHPIAYIYRVRKPRYWPTCSCGDQLSFGNFSNVHRSEVGFLAQIATQIS